MPGSSDLQPGASGASQQQAPLGPPIGAIPPPPHPKAPGGSAPEAQPPPPPVGDGKPEMVKYGELIVLGYNGQLPQGDKGRRRSKFVLYRRPVSNGVKKSKQYTVKAAQNSEAIRDSRQHSISYTLSRNQAVIVEYNLDLKTDLFQIGRSSESPIDFVVMDTVPGNKVTDKVNSQSTISRFACRILADRSSLSTRVFAAGFDSSRNIFLGERATKWDTGENGVDGLTTNGVLLMHPTGMFCPGEHQIVVDIAKPGTSTSTSSSTAQAVSSSQVATPGIWREVSVGGDIYGLRESRSALAQGPPIQKEENYLRDGSMIDLCGATLLWRSAEGLARSPTVRQLERCLDELNAGRPQCPVGLQTLVVPRRSCSNSATPETQPLVYLECGHVQGKHEWGSLGDSSGSRKCPMCLCTSSVAPLVMGAEPGFYVDCQPPGYCFVPCGHMASEQTVKYWASMPIPCGTCGFQSECPFCATPLTGTRGYVKLIFQDRISS